MRDRNIEIIVGLVSIICVMYFISFSYQNVHKLRSKDEYYELIADFSNIQGIKEKSGVYIAGINIGYVKKIELDPITYMAQILFAINNDINIPDDSRAVVSTTGVLGDKIINITPGGSDNTLKRSDKFKFTQSAVSLEDIIHKVVYHLTTNRK